MPELPEVETVRRGLAPAMEGARFAKVEARRGDLRWPLPKDFTAAARQDGRGARPAREISARRSLVRRRAADASRHVGLVPRVERRHEPRPATIITSVEKHRARPCGVSHVERRDRHLQRSAPLRFDEARAARRARRRSRCCARSARSRWAMSSTPRCWRDACAGKKTSLKAALIDQRVVAGLGNIYVCEALYRARLSPKRRGLDHRDANGTPNERAREAGRRHQGGAQGRDRGRRLVAARPPPHRRRARRLPAQFPRLRPRGQACPRSCKGKIKRIVQTGRSTFFCPMCQK